MTEIVKYIRSVYAGEILVEGATPWSGYGRPWRLWIPYSRTRGEIYVLFYLPPALI
jgi:hypothetical protein